MRQNCGLSWYVCLCSSSKLIVESDLSNAITWVSTSNGGPWKFQFILNEIKSLVYLIQVDFSHILHSGNAMTDAFAKQGVDHPTPVVFNL